MSIQLRYPSITGRTTEERQQQMERAMRSMVDQLNMMLKKNESSAESKSGGFEEMLNSKQGTKDYWKTIYPIGAIYISTSSTNPGTLFGGIWEQIKDRFLLAAGSSYPAGATGGAATHTLSVNEMPSHHHALDFYLDTWVETAEKTTNSVPYGKYTNEHVKTAYQHNSGTYEGGGAAHNNMPPYLAVYVWKRTK